MDIPELVYQCPEELTPEYRGSINEDACSTVRDEHCTLDEQNNSHLEDKPNVPQVTSQKSSSNKKEGS